MELYENFIKFASKKLKKDFGATKKAVEFFLEKYNLTTRTIECYLRWGRWETHFQIAKKLHICRSLVTQELLKLKTTCPELFYRGPYVPDIPQMVHLTPEQWRIFEEQGLIKEKF